MRFRLIDQIVELEPGMRITALKRLCPEEEYLRDHFPRFPVMPGVLMLEAMFQAAAWLVRTTEDFLHAVVLLKEVRNVKYADFVEPGQVLTVTAEILKQEEQTTTLKVQGTVDDALAVSGRLILERFNLADRCPKQSAIDAHAKRSLRREFNRLYQPPGSPETICR